MGVSQKFVDVLDNVIDCIPIVSSISNIAQALYKLASKVDAFNPAAPRETTLKRTLQIHIFSKSSASHFLASIPVLGNLCMFAKLVIESFSGFEAETPLKRAIRLNNKEVVSLSVENGELERSESPGKILRLAGAGSNEILKLVLSARDWSAKDLIGALDLIRCVPTGNPAAPNVATILKYWKEANKEADQEDGVSLVHLLNRVLGQNEVGLARQVIEILPNQTPFTDMLRLIFHKFGVPKLDSKGDLKNEALLNKDDREALMAKIGKPSFLSLIEFFDSSSFEHEAEFEIFYQLFEKADLKPEEIKTAISYALRFGQLALGEALFEKYQDQLSLDLKIEIFKGLLSYEFDLDEARTLARFAQQSREQPLQEIASLYHETVIRAYTESLIVVGQEEDVTILKNPLEAFKIEALTLLEGLKSEISSRSSQAT